MDECGLCFGDPEDCGCQEWEEYWNSLTPEEQRREYEMMALHVEETRESYEQ